MANVKLGKENAADRLIHNFEKLPASAVAVLLGVPLDVDMPIRFWMECKSLQTQVDALAQDMLMAENEMSQALQGEENT